MVRAGKARPLSAAGGTDDRAPVSADVQKGVRRAVLVPSEQKRDAHEGLGLVTARFGQFQRQGDGDRGFPEDALHLPRITLRVGIGIDRDRHLGGSAVGRPVLKMSERAPGEFGRFVVPSHVHGVVRNWGLKSTTPMCNDLPRPDGPTNRVV